MTSVNTDVNKQIRLPPSSIGSVNTIRFPRIDVVGSVNTIRLRRYGWNTFFSVLITFISAHLLLAAALRMISIPHACPHFL